MLQLGYNLIAPFVVCIAVCYWLTESYGVGSWVYLIGILFGLGAAASACYRFYQSEMRRQKRKKDKDPVAFNEHI